MAGRSLGTPQGSSLPWKWRSPGYLGGKRKSRKGKLVNQSVSLPLHPVTHQCVSSLTDSLTHSDYSPTPTHTIIYSLTQLVIHSHSFILTHSLAHSFTLSSPTQPHTHSPTQKVIHSHLIYLFILSSILSYRTCTSFGPTEEAVV